MTAPTHKHPNIETELKFEVNPVQIARIKNLSGLSLSAELHQSTIMFDNADKLMEYTGGRVRLRRQGDHASLSYKKTLPSEGTEKQEIEFETEVGDAETIANVLRMMGYAPTTSYEKYVAVGEFNGVIIELQRYPFAMFLEIEGEKRKIERVAEALSLDLSRALLEPVDTLYCEWRMKRGLPFKPHMRFADYDK